MKKLVQSLFIVLLLVTTVMAQDRVVKGVVTAAEDGLPLPGVSVSVKGTTSGTQTNANGQYSLKITTSNPVLVFSFIGTKTQELAVPASNTLNVKMVSDAEQLSEVVVVGYGSTTKESFTGSAIKIGQENIERKNVSSVGNALAGEVAGLRVVNKSGQPGEAPKIRIRGIGSVNGSRDPLYVVDGVPFSGDITSINNADIESATVLKDAAATAIYGSRGANGVIIITTKSGRGKNSFVEADVNYGVNMDLLPRYKVIKSPEDYVGLAWESLYNYGRKTNEPNPVDFADENLFDYLGPSANIWNVADGSELIDPITKKVRPGVKRQFDPENWADYAFQSSNRSDINVKFGGSSDKTNYYSSFGYLNDKGYSINSDFQRLTGRLNLDHKVNSWLSTGMNFNFARSKRNVGGQSEDSGNIFWFVDNMPSVYPLFLRDANGNKIPDPYYGGFQFDYGDDNSGRQFGSLTNAIADATYDIMRHNRSEINGRAYVNFNIIKGLTFENSLGIQYYNNVHNDRRNKYYGSAASTGGYLYQEHKELKSYNLLNLLRYKFSINDHSIEALAAHEASDYSLNTLELGATQLVDQDILEYNNATVFSPITSFTNSYAIESFFGQINYDFAKKYYLSGSLRRDGSSRFLNNKWGTFGSVGAGWIISHEDFLKNQDYIKFLKLKASYGVIGDQAGVGYYSGYDLYTIENNNDKPALIFDSKGNPDLTWETSKMFQTGVEFDLGNYLSATLDYYIKNTSNLIFNRQIGPSIGYQFIQVNDGNLRNQGFEFDLTGHILKSKKYYIDLGVNGEMFKNKLTKMPIDPSTGSAKIIDVQGQFGWSEGHSIYDYYIRDFVGVDPADGSSMWKVYYTDNNGNGVYDADEGIPSLALFDNPNNQKILETTTKEYSDATQFYVGKSAIPKIRGAFRLNAGYKNFDLSVQMLYSFGGYAYDAVYATLMNNSTVGMNNWHQDIFARWQEPGDITNVPSLNNQADENVSALSSRFLTKSNFVSLNNIRLGYNFDQNLLKNIGVGGLSVWVSGDNLWMHSARKGFNPSASEAGTSERYRYSPLSTFSAGLRARF